MKKFIFLLAVLGQAACSTQFKVVSEPDKAEVFFINGETGEKKKLGETPLEKKDGEIRDMLGGADPGKFYAVSIEKEGFENEKIWVPISPSGAVSTEIKLKLKAEDKKQKNLEKVGDILDQIFLAQTFAHGQQFERALIEIDKVLAEYPSLARVLAMKAAIYYARREFAESLKWYEKTLEANPQNEQAIQMVAKVKKMLNQPATGGVSR